MNPAVGYHRSHAFSYLKYLFVAQVAFSLAVCGFTPSGICDDATIQHWVVAVMSWAAPTMLTASHGCAANGVLLFFHAVMVSIWPLFAIAAAALILTAPRVHSVSAKSPIKPRTSRITLVTAYALVALLLAFLAAAVFHGAYYELAGAPPLHTWRHQAVAALFNALWRLSPRAGLAVDSLVIWPALTVLVALLATLPGVLSMYWQVIPWVKRADS